MQISIYLDSLLGQACSAQGGSTGREHPELRVHENAPSRRVNKTLRLAEALICPEQAGAEPRFGKQLDFPSRCIGSGLTVSQCREALVRWNLDLMMNLQEAPR